MSGDSSQPMRYALLRDVGDLCLQQKPIPDVGPDQVLIRVAACAVCGTDVAVYSGKFPTRFPYSPGHEYAGTVVAVGDAVAHLGRGDRVAVDPNYACGVCHFCTRRQPHLCTERKRPGIKSNGGFAEYVAVPARIAHRLPSSLTLRQGVLAESLSCALHALERAESLLDRMVCIVGGGAQGMLILELVQASGAAGVVLSEPMPARRDFARTKGAACVVDPQTEDLLSIVRSRSGGRGADAVFETSGSVEAAAQAVRLAAPGGMVVLVGVCDYGKEIAVSPFEITTQEVSLVGSFLNPHTFTRSISLLAQRRVDVDAYLGPSFCLEDVEQAFTSFPTQPALKVTVEP